MKERVLLVDDERRVLRAYHRHLGAKYAVDLATSGREALEKIVQEQDYAVVVADYRMPGMDGIELLTRIKESHPNTVRIMLTGYATMDAAIQAVNEGHVFLFLAKPLPAKELADAVQAAVEHHRLLAASKPDLQEKLQTLLTQNRDIEQEKQAAEEQLESLSQALEATIHLLFLASTANTPPTRQACIRRRHYLVEGMADYVDLTREERLTLHIANAIDILVPTHTGPLSASGGQREISEQLAPAQFPWPVEDIAAQSRYTAINHISLEGTAKRLAAILQAVRFASCQPDNQTCCEQSAELAALSQSPVLNKRWVGECHRLLEQPGRHCVEAGH